MLRAAYIVIGALLLWIIFRECGHGQESVSPTITEHEQAITTDKARVADLEAQGSTISRKLVNDSIRHAEALQVSESRISGLTKSLAAAIRKAPTIIRDTVYLVMDSIIVEQASQLTRAHRDYDSLNINYAALLSIKDQELKVKDEIADHMTAINQSLFKTLNKEKRKGKVAKVLIPVVFVLGFVIGKEL